MKTKSSAGWQGRWKRGIKMDKPEKLVILWTTDNVITSRDMVFMYAGNAMKFGWWDEVVLIIWGASAVLAAGDSSIQSRISGLMGNGVEVVACRACAERHDAVDSLQKLGVRVEYIGSELTEYLKSENRVISI
jgi:hypothetical protein